MLEAPDLKTRAEILVAVTEIELAKSKTDGRDAAAIAHDGRTISRMTDLSADC